MERPISAYRGDGPYVFVSYAHADSEVVYAELARLAGEGFNLWYDEGITPSARWTDELATAVEHCSVFLAYISPNFVSSETCLNELDFALNRKRPVLAVHLANTTLPAGVELALGGKQAVHRYQLKVDAYENTIRETLEGLIAGEFRSRVPTGQRRGRRRLLWPAVAALALVAIALFALVANRQQVTSDAPSQPTIGVLPFEVIGAGADDTYLSEGIAEDLSMRLGSWRSIPVIAHASMIREDLPADLGDAARQLNARYLVRGKARFEDHQVMITAHLIDGESEAELWSERFVRPRSSIFELQEELANAIVARLKPVVVQAESERAARKDPRNVSAWEAAFRGWWHVNRDTRADMARARDWFQIAIEQDPTWSWPHATTALTHYRELVNGWSASAEDSATAMRISAEQAMSLDASDAFSHHALGHAYQRFGRTDEALAAFARGVELAPFDAMANACYGMQLAASNQPARAIEAVQHAMEISPKDPWSHWFALVMARAYYAAGDYLQAQTWADRSLQLKPTPGAMFHSIAATAMLGDVEAAQQRVAAISANQPLPPLSMLEQGLSVTTEAGYVSRLIEGLRLAGFET